MLEDMPLWLGLAGAVGVGWRFGFGEAAVDFAGSIIGRGANWLMDPDSSVASLSQTIPYRDFYDEVFETRDNVLWSGLVLRPISTDGFSNRDWNNLSASLNRCLTTLPDGTLLQIITRVENSADSGIAVMEDLAARCEVPSMRQVAASRARHLELRAKSGGVRVSRVYAFVGRKMRPRMEKVSPKSIISSKEFEDLERHAFESLANEVLRCRDTFATTFISAGGQARYAGAYTAFAIAYDKLNPKRALTTPPPAFVPASLEARVPPDEMGDADEAVMREYSDLFGDSKRETLCFTPVDVDGDHFRFGDLRVMTVSLQRMPVKVFAGLMELFTRVAGLDFSYEVNTTFEVGNQQEWDGKLESTQRKLRVALRRSANPDQVEELKESEVYDLRRQIRTGDEKLGLLGMNITFSAPNKDEMERRGVRVTDALRTLEGMEGVADPHMPFNQFLATLPGGQWHGTQRQSLDKRRKPCLSSDAISLAAVTGGSWGTGPDDCIEVLERADGGLFYWNPYGKGFNSGMALICGGSGSGKSVFLNRLRTAMMIAGRRGVTLDFGGSSYRICRSVGGNYIDINDPSSASGIGLFAIWPREDEVFSPEELTEEGIPIDRLADVSAMLEMLCLDPQKPQETALEPRLASFLYEKVHETYGGLVDETPTIDNFIDALAMSRGVDRDKGDELASRLRIYASNGALGRFLNDQSEPLSVDSPYTVFDFSTAVDDKRLMLVAAMGVSRYANRLLRTNRQIGKFFDVDEFKVVSQNPLLCKIIDRSMRTARKLNCVCAVASQDPEDFMEDSARGIRSNCEVRWLFSMPNVPLAAQAFDLTPGVARLVARLSSNISTEYKDCVVTFPGNGVAHLRLRNSVLDKRLLMGAGRELATLEDAVRDIALSCGEEPDRHLLQSLIDDGMGVGVGASR